jgi:protein arginine kinase
VSGLLQDGALPLPAWAAADGPQAEIVLATRVRLARNIAGEPFPGSAAPREREQLAGDLAAVVAGLPGLEGARRLELGRLSTDELLCLHELQLLGPGQGDDPAGRILLLGPGLRRTAQVGDEDHLRLQTWRAGLDPEAALAEALAWDADLEREIEPAFAEDLGYLTASPANVGTGLRISALLHLPGLVLGDEIEKVLNALRQLQFSVRGLAGDGATVRGSLFLVANMVCLGLSEQEVAADFRANVLKIATYERLAREQLFDRDPLGLEDMAWRSLATLQSARLISGQETWDRLSNVRLGADQGVLPGPAPAVLNRATLGAQSGHLALAAGRSLAGRERGEARADFLRGLLAGPAA